VTASKLTPVTRPTPGRTSATAASESHPGQVVAWHAEAHQQSCTSPGASLLRRGRGSLAAEWHRTYGGTRPDLAQALEFYDRWLPGTMRRITGITRKCIPQCVTLRGPGDWDVRPEYH